MSRPRRDYDAERRERDSFILLQHAYTSSHGIPEVPLSAERLGADLGLRPEQVVELVLHLECVGHLAVHGEGAQVALRSAGVEYIEQLAWRRNTVRVDADGPKGV